MLLTFIFKNFTREQFSEQFSIEMQLMTQEVNSELMWAAGGSFGDSPRISSLLDLREKFPKVFEQVCGERKAGHSQLRDRSQKFFESPAFQAVWLLDGAKFTPQTLPLALWSSLVENLCRQGAHGWFYKMPFQDPVLALKAVNNLISMVLDSPFALSSLTWLESSPWRREAFTSLQGFNVKPELAVDTDKRLKWRVASYFTEGNGEAPDLRLALRDWVYNEALRLKSQGYPTHQVVHRLSERINLVFDQAFGDSQSLPVGQLYPLFHRQVLINALAAFPDDLAHLDASAAECYGHLSASASDSDRQLIRSLTTQQPTSHLTTVFNGPVFMISDVESAFTPYHVALSLEDKGVPIDLDLILTGHLNNHKFTHKAIVCDSQPKYSKALENLFASLPHFQDKSTPQARKIVDYATLISPPEHYSTAAKFGFVVGLIENARLKLANGEYLSSRHHPAYEFQDDAPLWDEVLGYLQRTGPMDQRLLKWCGFGSDVLSKLSAEDQERLAEHYLGDDLGL
ncbi:hypothetical protein DV532_27130 (plasmid) [Pseudomonas sp. Leaf58]|uniref:hypothetical protein n=1 Tax=Pseudomonas sp. Leaf58 TaxID=1736226 RepID=UPI0006F75072|nr:hypothetical protein [Pseudomonas sp. Leaf58]AYG47957.1 hypothetical protein DV532_27130 [Pseudomonas sp. Leaf58]KQN62481.1 hypothetical protein ASF02_10045 [Pseudomonas sp. Leaf58]